MADVVVLTRAQAPLRNPVAGRALGRLGLATVLTGAALVLLLHYLEPQVDPFRRTISEYALREHAWVFNLAVLAVAAGSAVTLAALVRAGLTRWGSLGSVGLALWSLALAGVVVFPKHNWARGASMSGDIHRALSLVAFASLPIAAIALALAARRIQGRTPRPVLVAGVASVLAFLPLPAVVVIGAMTGTRWWQVLPLGVTERTMALVETLTVVVLAVWAIRRRPAVTDS